MIPRPISLRVSLTEACPLRCRYCRAANESAPLNGPGRLTPHELALLFGVLHHVIGIEKLRLTGGEPLLRDDLPGLIAAAAGLGIDDIALTTNGARLAPQAETLRRSGLRRINISLDSLHPQTYASITRGGDLSACLDGIRATLAAKLHPVKLNMVLLRGINDHEVIDLLEFGLETGCHIRYLELMPIGVAAHDFERRFVASNQAQQRLDGCYRLDPLPYQAGQTSRDFRVQDGRGRSTICGFISPTSQPFCEGCNRLRLTHDGRLLGCLARRDSRDLRPALNAARDGNPVPLRKAVAEALALKQYPRDLADQRHMARIGG